ncbi:MAG TPA: glycoside hydrolase family 3 N-terminal domain-containing protein [Gemmatimonadales bacterium]|nr:glycoside hydrolase family 3 N-terminal domain-containing protein [Gemmatimonadales bacterium]
MSTMKLLRLIPLLALGAVAAPACSLPPPPGFGNPDAAVAGLTCTLSPDAGAPNIDSSVIATGDVENVIPVTAACPTTATTNNHTVIDPYTQGYDYADPAIVKQVNATMASISVSDEILQLQGMPYLDGGGKNYRSIQRSQDTTTIRGFRYRDASRGMNLGEDMDGSLPNASGMKVGGQYVGYSTSFPVSMARGAAFDLDLEAAVGEAIGDEMQAAQQTLLLAPCMNLLRHPFWGRAQETYGEDPYHIGRLASAMVVGIQQHIAADAKHYMGYDVETDRQTNDSDMDEQTLREIYGRHFRMVVQDSGVASVMASYNEVNGTKSAENGHNLTDVLRQDFGFKGFILSDWWAMPGYDNIPDATTLKTHAQLALNAGLEVELPWGLYYGQLENLFNTKNIKKQQLDAAAQDVLYEKYRFNSASLKGSVGLKAPVTVYNNGRITCNYTHVGLAKKAAVESMVLLKNQGGVLPISPSVKSIAVVGATVPYLTNAFNDQVNFATDVRGGDLGSSRVYPDPAKSAGPYQGICIAAGGTWDPNAHTCGGGPITVTTATNTAGGDLTPVMAAAANADFVVVMAGLTPQDEGEQYTGAADRSFGATAGDALELDAKQTGAFAGIQDKLISQVAATGKPMVVVLEGGSVINVPWLDQVPALVMAWYPGMRGGEALGDLLIGEVNGVSYNFAGKLPFTWGTLDQYGDTFDGQSGQTQFDYFVGYRYFDQFAKTPVFPFGAGLSYTTFELSNLQLGCSNLGQGGVLPVVVNVKNTGTVAGDEIVMVFVSFPNTQARRAKKELKGFARVSLAAGEAKQVTINVRVSDLDYFDTTDSTPGAGKGNWIVESGPMTIMVGDGSTNFSPDMTKTINVNGYTVPEPVQQ